MAVAGIRITDFPVPGGSGLTGRLSAFGFLSLGENDNARGLRPFQGLQNGIGFRQIGFGKGIVEMAVASTRMGVDQESIVGDEGPDEEGEAEMEPQSAVAPEGFQSDPHGWKDNPGLFPEPADFPDLNRFGYFRTGFWGALRARAAAFSRGMSMIFPSCLALFRPHNAMASNAGTRVLPPGVRA